MNFALAVAAGAAIGALHLLLLLRGVQVFLASEGSGAPRRRWAFLAGGRWIFTLLLGLGAIRFFGLQPVGVGAGLVLAVWSGRLAAWILARKAERASKELSA